MRTALLALGLVAGGIVAAGGQAPPDGKLLGQLKQLFPAAATFSPKSGNPPVFRAFADQKSQDLLGLVFWTTEIEPLERGYDGPIKMLVAMDTKGVLAGVIVVEHHEPYGRFSVDPPQFAAQFKNKSIRDPFKVGVDIDAVTTASISITSASRAIRNSARRVAKAHLAPPEPSK